MHLMRYFSFVAFATGGNCWGAAQFFAQWLQFVPQWVEHFHVESRWRESCGKRANCSSIYPSCFSQLPAYTPDSPPRDSWSSISLRCASCNLRQAGWIWGGRKEGVSLSFPCVHCHNLLLNLLTYFNRTICHTICKPPSDAFWLLFVNTDAIREEEVQSDQSPIDPAATESAMGNV